VSDYFPAIAVSTWSLHRAIGVSYPNSPENDSDRGSEPTWGAGNVSIMEVPARIKAAGIDRLEICHFNVPGRDRGWHKEFRDALDEAGVTLQTLLIDAGDITDPVNRRRDIAWISRWLDVAVALGAERARVIAGKQRPTAEVLDDAVAGLAELATHGESVGMHVITENWHDTLAGPSEVHYVLDRLAGRIGLIADFANWNSRGASKYDDLRSILARAEDTHATAAFSPDLVMNDDDYGRCFAAAIAAGYRGPHTLIYAGPNDDEWSAIARQRDFVRDYLARAAA
jgi:sugar phosphate isomerase/epimerase